MRETAFIVQVVSQGRNMNQLLNRLRSLARCGRTNRRVLTSLALLFLAIDVPTAFAQHVVNPFAGATQYVNPDYAKEQCDQCRTHLVCSERSALPIGAASNSPRQRCHISTAGANIQQSVCAVLGFSCLV
jgi:hypothetical protein